MIGASIARLGRRLKRRHFRHVVRVPKRSLAPSPLRSDTVYRVGSPEQWIMFVCPCGLGHDIALSIGVDGVWRLDAGRRGKRSTIHPSVNAGDSEHRCHFWVRDGNVVWCRDSPPSPHARARSAS